MPTPAFPTTPRPGGSPSQTRASSNSTSTYDDEAHSGTASRQLPLGVAYVMFTCWRQIYGIMCMAVYGHLDYAFTGCRALFDDMIAGLLERLGLQVSPNLRP
ncbi:hypothetical protein ACFVU3_39560 [Streptomyces sp. NPDC058052]|uniref:hypothetical protein n=1 Tax=Streptomyces sp. NPDC058052 TaxID=3346316 RepID=UPI0036E90804